MYIYIKMGALFRHTYPYFKPGQRDLDAPDPGLWETLQLVYIYMYILAILVGGSQKDNKKITLQKKITLWLYKYVCMFLKVLKV